jgi:hypothetical protein
MGVYFLIDRGKLGIGSVLNHANLRLIATQRTPDLKFST